MTWPEYFFGIINSVKVKSKDPHTKVGCVIVGPDNEIRSTGYNSFVRGLKDDVPERLVRVSEIHPLYNKYSFIEHSERNAIYNAAAVGIPIKGCTIYMQGLPCIDCARAIIQSRIKEIIFDGKEWDKWNSPKYDQKSIAISLEILKETGVKITRIDIEGTEVKATEL